MSSLLRYIRPCNAICMLSRSSPDCGVVNRRYYQGAKKLMNPLTTLCWCHSLGHFNFLAFHWLNSHQIRYMMFTTTY